MISGNSPANQQSADHRQSGTAVEHGQVAGLLSMEYVLWAQEGKAALWIDPEKRKADGSAPGLQDAPLQQSDWLWDQ